MTKGQVRDTLGILLAGGRGARLGADVPKALAVLGGETLLARARRTLGAVCDECVVCAPAEIAAQLGAAPEEIVHDAPGAEGPLAGLAAGFAARRFHHAIVLGVDFPLVRAGTLRDLLGRLGGHDAVIPEPGGRAQPLVAVYGALAARALADDFADGERSIVAATRVLDAVRLGDAELEAIEGGLAAFMNVNTREDLAEAERMLAGERVRSGGHP